MSVVDLLQRIGVEIHLDWDGELLVDCPDVISRATLEEAIESQRESLRIMVRNRAAYRMQQLVGGPFNGQHNDFPYCPAATYGKRVKRAKWAVYQQGADGRAFFRGYATSERKARRGQLASSP